VPIVLVTGMSGTGKSSVLAELARRGHRVVDTDDGDWVEEVRLPDGQGPERMWRDERIAALLDQHEDGALFVSGCVANQGTFYPRFDAIVLLRAPVAVILERIATRKTNRFGRTDAEREAILRDISEVEPLLRAGATDELDTRAPLADVAQALERIAARTAPR
jgi:dephospho-CoA kinase